MNDILLRIKPLLKMGYTLSFIEAELLKSTIDLVDQQQSSVEKPSFVVSLPRLPELGSSAEWYEGYFAGAKDMRNGCASAIRAAGGEIAHEQQTPPAP
ncbi:hypothetical protein IFU23_06635 [Pantoea agglomerans]|uniref:Uncharacterized protein n=1 Tax=Enterobacter agglomerans TaxID=549 RepID=A0ACC5PVR2_ENTAG|nr:hypothetical protein [Pantoea agglomerans]MBD8129181.1 hypothetical protein [Pantoea agglomerans]MBD8153770.1 hypothetical protein [Pantoea agglomerans]MBD8157783.1 hypothetical protein [Pantoea agglomerans]MBD8231621.1 hypothetical protein [Pantoea agglomerans]MBD8241685.1 hypothetical protein [Pantoea agglomerans]